MTKILVGIFILILLSILGWAFMVTTPKFNMNDTNRILSEGDSYFSMSYHHQDQTISAKSFSGLDTFFTLDGGSTIDIELNITLSSGQMRVVWISPDNIIHDLKDGVNTLELMPGKHRLKVVGNRANFELSYRLSDNF